MTLFCNGCNQLGCCTSCAVCACRGKERHGRDCETCLSLDRVSHMYCLDAPGSVHHPNGSMVAFGARRCRQFLYIVRLVKSSGASETCPTCPTSLISICQVGLVLDSLGLPIHWWKAAGTGGEQVQLRRQPLPTWQTTSAAGIRGRNQIHGWSQSGFEMV